MSHTTYSYFLNASPPNQLFSTSSDDIVNKSQLEYLDSGLAFVFGGFNLQQYWRVGQCIGVVISDKPQSLWIFNGGAYKTVQQGLKASVRIIPIKCSGAVSLNDQSCLGKRRFSRKLTRQSLAKNTYSPRLPKLTIFHPMHLLDDIQRRGLFTEDKVISQVILMAPRGENVRMHEYSLAGSSPLYCKKVPHSCPS